LIIVIIRYIFTLKQKNHPTQVRNIHRNAVYTIVKLQNKNNLPDRQVENKTGKSLIKIKRLIMHIKK